MQCRADHSPHEADTANAGYTETPANGSDGLRPAGLYPAGTG